MLKEELIKSLRQRGFSKKILNAFERVERKEFIPSELERYAYEDRPLPIGAGQTISQPYTIAFMLDLLELRDKQKILEIGSGSGYVLALISEISKNSKVYGVERIKRLAGRSKRVLKDVENISIIHSNGSKGLKEKAPFDRVLVSAAADELPQNLIDQLKVGGILVVPVRGSIFYVKKLKSGNKIEEFAGFRFVPLIEEE